MSPESVQMWQFTHETVAWAFGVLMWEMFCFGVQPYCGYSNHEVLDMIRRRRLLSCPDQCPAKLYSLMMECWNISPLQRPSFKVTSSSHLDEMTNAFPFLRFQPISHLFIAWLGYYLMNLIKTRSAWNYIMLQLCHLSDYVFMLLLYFIIVYLASNKQ